MKKERYDRVSKEWFEKGKLEQKKEELEFLEYFERCSKNIGSIQTIINRWSYNVEQRIKQLKKEIGGGVSKE